MTTMTELEKRVVGWLQDGPLSASDVYEKKNGRRPLNIYQSQSQRAYLNRLVAKGTLTPIGAGADRLYAITE